MLHRFGNDILGQIGSYLNDRDIKNARLAHPCLRDICGFEHIKQVDVNRKNIAGFEKRLQAITRVFKNASTLRVVITDMEVALYDIVTYLRDLWDGSIELVSMYRVAATLKHLQWFSRITCKITRVELLAFCELDDDIYEMLSKTYAHSRILVNVVALATKPVSSLPRLPHMMAKLELNNTQTYVLEPEVFHSITFGRAFGLAAINKDMLPWMHPDKLTRLRKVKIQCDVHSTSIIELITRLPPMVELTFVDMDFFLGLEVLYFLTKNKMKNKVILDSSTSELYAQARILKNLPLYYNIEVIPMELLENFRIADLRPYIRRCVRRKIEAILYMTCHSCKNNMCK